MTQPLIKKKQSQKARPLRWVWLVFAACLVFAAAALLLRESRVSTVPPQADASPTLAGALPTPVSTAATALGQREAAYQADVAALQALAHDEAADAQARADAGEALAALVGRHQLQADLEAALRAMRYAPCLAVYQNDALTLLLAADGLDEAQRAALLALCLTHVPVRAENVRIVTGAALE